MHADTRVLTDNKNQIGLSDGCERPLARHGGVRYVEYGSVSLLQSAQPLPNTHFLICKPTSYLELTNTGEGVTTELTHHGALVQVRRRRTQLFQRSFKLGGECRHGHVACCTKDADGL